jgi:hypothetical protein
VPVLLPPRGPAPLMMASHCVALGIVTVGAVRLTAVYRLVTTDEVRRRERLEPRPARVILVEPPRRPAFLRCGPRAGGDLRGDGGRRGRRGDRPGGATAFNRIASRALLSILPLELKTRSWIRTSSTESSSRPRFSGRLARRPRVEWSASWRRSRTSAQKRPQPGKTVLAHPSSSPEREKQCNQLKRTRASMNQVGTVA